MSRFEPTVWQVVLAVLGGVVLLWVVLVVALAASGPRGRPLTEMLRLLPDVLRLVGRLARDPAVPRGVRWRLGLLLAYLALPLDLVPDFLPVIGYADDAIVVALVLRGVVRRAGHAAVERHWPGTPDGLRALLTVLRVSPVPSTDPATGEARSGDGSPRPR